MRSSRPLTCRHCGTPRRERTGSNMIPRKRGHSRSVRWMAWRHREAKALRAPGAALRFSDPSHLTTKRLLEQKPLGTRGSSIPTRLLSASHRRAQSRGHSGGELPTSTGAVPEYRPGTGSPGHQTPGCAPANIFVHSGELGVRSPAMKRFT